MSFVKNEKLVLVGRGFIAPRHEAAIKYVGGELLAVCDLDSAKAINDLPFCRHYPDLQLMPCWKDINTVVVATPNDTHVEIAKWALDKGKKVILEKPAALNLKELSQIQHDDCYVVLQLRHHPVMERLRMRKPAKVYLYVKVKRGHDYWTGWKGDHKRSGGILANLGCHYLDCVLELYGYDYTVIEAETGERLATGLLKFKNGPDVRFRIEIGATDEECDRFIQIDDEFFRFSNKENLSQEDLHKNVYEDFVQGKGVRPDDLIPLTELLDQLTL